MEGIVKFEDFEDQKGHFLEQMEISPDVEGLQGSADNVENPEYAENVESDSGELFGSMQDARRDAEGRKDFVHEYLEITPSLEGVIGFGDHEGGFGLPVPSEEGSSMDGFSDGEGGKVVEKPVVNNKKEKCMSCNLCGMKFTHTGTLNAHMRVHTNERPYECSVCGNAFSHKSTLTTHMRRHTQEKPFLCSECGKSFSHRGTLNAHMRIHNDEKPFPCTECGKHFGHKSHLNRHLKIHTEEKPYSCHICGMCFTQTSHVNTHMRVHTKEKPYSCIECGQCFGNKSTLDTHVRVHTKEKPFTCLECGRSFSVKSTLTAHMRLHTQERPYSCNVCGKSFSQKSALNTHMRVHTEEKPFSCTECGTRFSQKCHLNRHMRIHIEGRPYKKNNDAMSLTNILNMAIDQKSREVAMQNAGTSVPNATEKNQNSTSGNAQVALESSMLYVQNIIMQSAVLASEMVAAKKENEGNKGEESLKADDKMPVDAGASRTNEGSSDPTAGSSKFSNDDPGSSRATVAGPSNVKDGSSSKTDFMGEFIRIKEEVLAQEEEEYDALGDGDFEEGNLETPFLNPNEFLEVKQELVSEGESE